MPRRSALLFACLLLALCAACARMEPVTLQDAATEPSAYATVKAPPNPLLLGHWRRPPPPEFNKPWEFDFWLVQKGDKYAVYYHYDSRRKDSFKGWAEFTIDGDSMLSGVDGCVYYVEGSEVFMKYPGRDVAYKMARAR